MIEPTTSGLGVIIPPNNMYSGVFNDRPRMSRQATANAVFSDIPLAQSGPVHAHRPQRPAPLDRKDVRCRIGTSATVALQERANDAALIDPSSGVAEAA